jgi:hypothetical protein
MCQLYKSLMGFSKVPTYQLPNPHTAPEGSVPLVLRTKPIAGGSSTVSADAARRRKQLQRWLAGSVSWRPRSCG